MLVVLEGEVTAAIHDRFVVQFKRNYRQMTQSLVVNYWLVVEKETVRELLKIFHPDGVAARSRHRLQRRQYSTKHLR